MSKDQGPLDETKRIASQPGALPQPEPAAAAGDDSQTIASPVDRTQLAGAAQAPPTPTPTSHEPPAAPESPRRPLDPLLGKILGGCRLDALIGKGAMGAVYKAWQLSLEREVAVKVIRSELLEDVRALKRFQVEARTIARFRNAHVITVHDVGTDEGLHFLVMEFIDGRNLRQIARERPQGRLGNAESIDLLVQACQGLEEAQRLGVLHRDIKPDNLLLDQSGVLKIADFGIAKLLQDDLHMTLTAELTGTPLYMSPEQCRASAEIDFRSDMYSLGASFFYLLTGEPPVKASSIYQLIDTKTKLECLRLAQFLPEMDERHPLAQVIARMTALLPESRYQSYQELLADLARVKDDEPVALATSEGPLGKLPTPPPPLPKPRTKGRPAAEQEVAKAPPDEAETTPTPRRRAGALLAAAVALAGVAAIAVLRPWEGGANVDPNRDRIADTGGTGGSNGANTTGGPVVDDSHRDTTDANDTDGTDGGDARGNPVDGTATSGGQAQDAHASPDPDPDGAKAREDAERNSREEAERRERERRDAALRQDIALVEQTLRENGPSSDLVSRLAGATDDRGLARQRDALRADLEHANRTAAALTILRGAERPPTPTLPFADVRDYFAKVAQTLALPAVAGEPLRAWLASTLQQEPAQGDYAQRCVDALGGALRTVRTAPLPADATAARIDERERELARIEDGKRTLLELFAGGTWPQLAATLGPAIEDAAPTADLDAARQALAPLRALVALRANVRDALATLRDVRSLREWLARKPGLKALLPSDPTPGDGPQPADLAAGFAELREGVDRWEAAERRLGERLAHIARGELTLAGKVAATLSPIAEETIVAEAARRLGEAFAQFARDLDARALGTALGQGTRALGELPPEVAAVPPAQQHLRRLEEKLAELVAKADALAPIVGGRARVHGKGEVEVAGFYCGRTEVSVGEWREFLTALRPAEGTAWADVRAGLLERFGIAPTDANRTQRMFARALPETANEPVDRVSYHEAALYAAWRGLALPTLEEWSLLAFGDVRGPNHGLPFGGDRFRDDPAARNPSDRRLDPVASGGNSWRNAQGADIHHVAGNVAEWLAAPAAATEGQLAGGRCPESRQKQEERARGAPETVRIDAIERGFGLRVALRPQPFFGPLWPR